MKIVQILTILACIGCPSVIFAGDPALPIADQIDALLAKAYPPNAPGATAIVVSKGEILLRKGYGLADVELGVPMKPEDVFQIGSITKQFTAVAILQLVEAGKVNLSDDITAYVPELQTGGRKITLTHLLTHTSGLPRDLDEPQTATAWRRDITLSEMIGLIKGKQSYFAPGANWAYCNTGFFLLGAVIEKASGQSYGSYLDAHIFKPAGMTHSSYDQPGLITPHRVPGYVYGADGKPANAEYFSMTQVYAAGALLSNIDDLWRWEQALAAGKLVSPALLKMAYTSGHVDDGRATGYGFGWFLGTIAGHPTVEHGGDIPGFATYELRVADAGLYVAILCNSYNPPAPPIKIVHELASLMLGKADPVATVAVPVGQLEKYVGVYRLFGSKKYQFIVENGQLMLKRSSRSPSVALQALSTTKFFAPDSGVHFTFLPPSGEGPDRLLLHPPNGMEIYANRVNEPLEDPLIAVAAEILDKYAGDYELRPGFILAVKHVGDHLTFQPTGDSVLDLTAESPVRFHIKQANNAVIEFKAGADGHVTSLILHRDEAVQTARKIR